MAATVRAAMAVTSVGDATGSSVTVNRVPTMPVGTVAGDRVFIFSVATNTQTLVLNATGWNALLADTSLGGGTAGASTGTRHLAVWWRDYDGVWSVFPTVQSAAMAQNSQAIFAVSVQKAQGEAFVTPTVVTGSMTTASTSMSVASAVAVWATNMLLLMMDGFPSTTTTASGTVTATGVTFGTKTNTVTSGGTATGNDAAAACWTCPVTVGSGSSVAATHTATLGTSRTAGCAFVRQTTTPTFAPPPPNPWKRLQPLLVR